MAEKKTTVTATTPSPTPPAPIFIPMRSLLFNPVDGHAYLPLAYTRDNSDGIREDDGSIRQEDIPAHEWKPGKKLTPYTFLLNGKEYEAGFIPAQNPSAYEHIESFPTQETIDAVMVVVQRTFPGLNFTVVHEERTERVYAHVVNPVIQHNEDNFQPGAVALQIMLQGERVALGQLQARFKAASLF